MTNGTKRGVAMALIIKVICTAHLVSAPVDSLAGRPSCAQIQQAVEARTYQVMAYVSLDSESKRIPEVRNCEDKCKKAIFMSSVNDNTSSWQRSQKPTIVRNYRIFTNCPHQTRYILEMLYIKSLLPVLGLFLMLEDSSSVWLPGKLRQKRDVNWLDQEFFPDMSELFDLADPSPPGDAGVTTRDWENHRTQSSTFPAPLERTSVAEERTPVHHRNQHCCKPRYQRRKATVPLDPIGIGLMSPRRNRKDESEDRLEQ
ncbi:hypothetical protein DPEC_G00102170 [Dallia pectoralis]|uniref:Uncharacterized protein n=1 Tax=Dallia pectoralis TaxID=75939 RepID=A0ACC2GWM7_DALPE|nr:hypothetical protein DPEC_G00102170 [Dallia pectoralis]